ncbi:hypothetical protein ACJJIU_03750 [Microbulbifer sp. CnH-101-E]|uniref:hypothetical protein n=1 Tax=unclassified Microbulbifer TaxID=2619833 RepID=UPI00403A66CB
MNFDEEKLIQCGVKLAEMHDLPAPPHELFRRKIHELLIERENYEGALKGIITREEAALLVLQHFQTLICHSAGKNEVSLVEDWSSLVEPVTSALFVKSTGKA